VKGVFLAPETTVHEQGKGAAVEWQGRGALVTLGILAVEEQESLQVALWQSQDGTEWGTKPFAQFAQKFYPGTHQLAVEPEGRYLQARWHVNRWGRGDLKPSFRFYVFIAPL